MIVQVGITRARVHLLERDYLQIVPINYLPKKSRSNRTSSMEMLLKKGGGQLSQLRKIILVCIISTTSTQTAFNANCSNVPAAKRATFTSIPPRHETVFAEDVFAIFYDSTIFCFEDCQAYRALCLFSIIIWHHGLSLLRRGMDRIWVRWRLWLFSGHTVAEGSIRSPRSSWTLFAHCALIPRWTNLLVRARRSGSDN